MISLYMCMTSLENLSGLFTSTWLGVSRPEPSVARWCYNNNKATAAVEDGPDTCVVIPVSVY